MPSKSSGPSAPAPSPMLFDLETGDGSAALSGDTLTLPPYAIVILKEK